MRVFLLVKQYKKEEADGLSKKKNIIDIAKLANASPATVSRVLSESNYPVSEPLRKRVMDAAIALNYQPNIFGKMLKGGASKEIGIIVPTITNPFYALLISEIEQLCLANGYVPIMCSAYNNADLERRHIETLLLHQVAGIMISSIDQSGEIAQKLRATNTPYVYFDQIYKGTDANNVAFDFYEAGYMATEHLLQAGHKTIAFATPTIDRNSRLKVYEGYCQALKDYKQRVAGKWVFVLSETNDEGKWRQIYYTGQELAKMIIDQKTLPSAVFAINDMVAIGMIHVFREHGICVPTDISIVGMDDLYFSEMVDPSLTTIRQPAKETAQLSVEILLAQIQNPHQSPKQIYIAPQLVERKSVRKKYEKVR